MNNSSQNKLPSDLEIENMQKFKELDQEEKTSLEFLANLVLRRRRFFYLTLILFTSFTLVRTTWEKIYNPLYKGDFALLISDPIKQSSSTGIETGLLGSAAVFSGAANFDVESDIPTLRKVLKSQLVLEDLSKEFGINPKVLSSRIEINKDLKADGILEVSLISNNPDKDKLLLDKLSNLYVNYASLQTQKKLSDGLKFLSSQEPTITAKNFELRDKLERFRKQNNVFDPKKTSSDLTTKINLLENDIETLENNIDRLDSIKNEILNGELNTSGFTEFVGSDTGSIITITNPEEKLNTEIEELNEELAKALLVYTPSSYIVKNIQTRLDNLKPMMQKKQLKSIDIAIKSNIDNLELKKSDLTNLKKEFDGLMNIVNKYSELAFELEFSVNNLSGISAAKEQLQLELAQDSQPWTVIKPPTFGSSRIYPSYKVELVKSIVASFFVGLGLALLRDKFDNVFHNFEEIKKELKYPFLGHIPYVEYFANAREDEKSILEELSSINNDENISAYDRFFYQESLRNIYTSIRFLNSDNPLKVITITSSVPKEGKSLTNILLAKTLCEMDLKILQIDADLRKPQLHFRLGLNNITGLSNILTNQKLTLSDATQTVPGFKNWDIITSGTKPPDPTRLLNSQRMQYLIDVLRKEDKYDLIIFDTPPVIGLADSLLVSEKSDGLILLVSTNSVNKDTPKASIARSLESGALFLGIISNSVKKENKQFFGNRSSNDVYNTYANYAEVEDLEEESISTKQDDKYQIIKEAFLKNIKIYIDKIFNWLDN